MGLDIQILNVPSEDITLIKILKLSFVFDTESEHFSLDIKYEYII